MSQTVSTVIEDSQAAFDGTPLPDGWRWMKLGEVCTRISNGTSTTQNTEGKGLPVTRIETISNGKINPQKVGWIDAEVEDLERYILSAGDILFSHINSVERLGNCALYEGTPPTLVHGMNLLRLEVKKGLAEPFYLLSFFKSEQARKFYDANARRAIGQASLNTKDLSKLEIPLPSLSEQQLIASRLIKQMAAVERARAAAEAQLKAAKELPTAYLRAVYDSPEAKKWEKRRLKDLCNRITDGTHQPPPFVSSGVPFLFVRNIVSGRIDFNVSKYVSFEIYEELTRRCKPTRNDVLYSAVGSFGVAVIVDTDEPFTFQRHIAHLKPNHELIDARYLAHFLNSPPGKAQSEAVALGGAQRTVTLSSLAKFDIPLPPLKEQQRIAESLSEYIQAAEQTHKVLQDQLDSINKLPAALLRQAFTGKL